MTTDLEREQETYADHAREVASAMNAAAMACPNRQIRYELAGRAKEWEHAAVMYDDYDPMEVVIEMCSAVFPGMIVMDDDPEYPERRVVRVLQGGLSLHLENPRSPQGTYRNQLHLTSPVVVKA